VIEPAAPGPRASAALVLIATFALGIVAGAALLHIARLSLGPPPPPRPAIGGPEPHVPPLVHLARELDLEPGQIERVRSILEEGRGRIRVEADATRERIREVLTPEQRERFERLGPPPGPRDLPPREPGARRPPGPRHRPRP
jgi:Spy/CpxP family protein refolding chaperone